MRRSGKSTAKERLKQRVQERENPAGPLSEVAVSQPQPAPKVTDLDDLDKEIDLLQTQISALLPEKTGEALNKILQIAMARLNYNYVSTNLMLNSSKENLVEFFRNQLYENVLISPSQHRFLGFLAQTWKESFIQLVIPENTLYLEIIELIKAQYQKTPLIFEDVHRILHNKIIYDKFHEKDGEEGLVAALTVAQGAAGDPQDMHRFLNCSFYRESRELPHEIEMSEATNAFLSPAFNAFIQHYYPPEAQNIPVIFEVTPKPIVSSNEKYLASIQNEFQKIQQEVKAYRENVSPVLKEHAKWKATQTNSEGLLGMHKKLSAAKVDRALKTENEIRQEFFKLYSIKNGIENCYKQWKNSVEKLKRASLLSQEARAAVVVSLPLAPVASSSSSSTSTSTMSSVASVLSAASASVSASASAASLASSGQVVDSPLSSSSAASSLASSLSAVSASLSSALEARQGSRSEEDKKSRGELMFTAPLDPRDQRRRRSILGARHFNLLKDIFDIKLPDFSIAMDDVVNLIENALGGKKVAQEGCRYRFKLKQRLGDVFVATQSLHGEHGKDPQKKLSKFTLSYIRQFLEKAGYHPKSLEAAEKAVPEAAHVAVEAAVEGGFGRAVKAAKNRKG